MPVLCPSVAQSTACDVEANILRCCDDHGARKWNLLRESELGIPGAGREIDDQASVTEPSNVVNWVDMPHYTGFVVLRPRGLPVMSVQAYGMKLLS